MNGWQLGHRPGLDGLRGVAVLFVLVAHFGAPFVVMTSAPGNIGVTMFFTLSGFLITALLLEEHERTGTIRRGAFYLRRFRRLAPALVVAVVFGLTLERVVTGKITDWEHAATALTYTTNFLFAYDWSGDQTVLGHTWSLAVEEQFYLVWPFAMLLLVRLTRRQGLIALIYLAMLGPILRTILWDEETAGIRAWMGPDTRSDALLIGCALAVAMHGTNPRRIHGAWAAAALAILAALVPLRVQQEAIVVQYPLIAAAATAVIIYVIATRTNVPGLGSKLMRWAGTRSYGIYLYHGPIAVLMRTTDWGYAEKWAIGLPATLVVAELSYRFVEQPFRRRRSAEVVGGHDGGGEVQGPTPGDRVSHEQFDVLRGR